MSLHRCSRGCGVTRDLDERLGRESLDRVLCPRTACQRRAALANANDVLSTRGDVWGVCCVCGDENRIAFDQLFYFSQSTIGAALQLYCTPWSMDIAFRVPTTHTVLPGWLVAGSWVWQPAHTRTGTPTPRAQDSQVTHAHSATGSSSHLTGVPVREFLSSSRLSSTPHQRAATHALSQSLALSSRR